MMLFDLNDFRILNIKGVDYRCFMFNMIINDPIKLLNNSALDNKGILSWISDQMQHLLK